ncbi:hypothetical protein JKI95_09995 [Corynebacterium aquatimens]|uniref:hypothetical protein n=1 Tax=Corynebacterium aquatimens TaxID=1190508 RepID=UPI002540425B|nr:hypothetical protein [Corynebacterium aquatimens]QYH19415.1 hypothetical protein JKI95_09995 [Corynebacterium aquatimens]
MDGIYAFSATAPIPTPTVFHVQLPAGLQHKDLVFGVSGEDFEDVCSRNPSLVPSLGLDGAYVYSPVTTEPTVFKVGPVSLSKPGDYFFIRSWAAGPDEDIDARILGVGFEIPFQHGSLVRKLV